MEGPHCPWCGEHGNWEIFSRRGEGEQASTDALRCTTTRLDLGRPLMICGYVHWMKNAPEDRLDPPPIGIDVTARSEEIRRTLNKRTRVRALLFAIIAAAGEKVLAIRDWEGLVREAERADRAIEALTITHGRES